MTAEKEVIRTTCPRDCYDACGIVVVKRRGEVTRVLGDPDHHMTRGALCGKCALAYNGAWRDQSKRLLTPMRRDGRKGDGTFVAVSWAEAMNMMAARLNQIRDESGGHTVLHTHYTGTVSLLAGWYPMRLFNRIGATEIDPDTVCNKAGHAALEIMFGDSLQGFDPRGADQAGCLLIWGANPSASAPHVHKHWLRDIPAACVVVDPIRHETAAQATLHLQPYPGTDAALAFAMLHVLRREGMLDHAFLSAHTIGWEAVERQLDDCPPEWAEGVTGVPAGDIVKAAQMYGKGPSMLWLGQGLQRQPKGGNVFRACSLLPVATGMMGRPGTGLLYMTGPACRGINMDRLTAPHLRPSGAPGSVSHMDLAARLEDRKASRALVTWNNNIAASSPEQNRLRSALEREDLFHVAIDLFATDTTAYADLVLPAASFLEFDDLVLSYFNYSVSAQVRASDPMGNALPNQEIFRRLAAAMGLKDPELFELDGPLLDELVSATGISPDFRTLATAGTLHWANGPVVPFADGHFPTASGKVEIVSARFIEAGLPLAPVPDADPRPTEGRLRVLSPASPWLMNSSYGNDDRIRALQGDATVSIHPDEAARRGLCEGQLVTLVNQVGRLPGLKLALTNAVPVGVALVPKGRWPAGELSRSNVNVLFGGAKTDLAESTAVHGVEAELLPMSQLEGV
ncbi:MAG TPA: molybdopterin-dependent oxidoreductase [Magnetospirillum sp.]|nr:molybdopterin-dependent oxidoreductase [Magnetospirillum sp.]